MSHLEIVHLRASGESVEALGQRIEASLMARQEGAETVVVYRQNGLGTDLAVHVHHPAATQGKRPSAIGLRLASALRDYGLVEHTYWERLT